MPDLTISRRLDGGYSVAAANRRRLEVTPQGMRYARQFWPTFKPRRSNLRVGIGRSVVEGPDALIRTFERPRSPCLPPAAQIRFTPA